MTQFSDDARGETVTAEEAAPPADAASTPDRNRTDTTAEAPRSPNGKAADDAASDRAAEAAAKLKKGPRRRHFVLMVLLVAAIAGGGWFGYFWWTVGRFEISTDDAYVGADMTLLAAKVSGYVASVDVRENQPVKKGDIIARIGDGDYRLTVEAARNKVATQEATIARIHMQAGSAAAAIEAARAKVLSARAEETLTAASLARRIQLVKKEFASIQTLDNARAARDKAAAAMSEAQANLATAQANLAVINAQAHEAEQTLQEMKTALAQAERDLSFTVVRAPIDGVVGNKSVEIGQLVQPGSRLAAIVPLDDVYVDANFKETQLEDMHPGQIVNISVDAYPNRHFTGTVASISPASGSLFSLLPPENATGNFTKIVQRLPVRITFSHEVTGAHLLRPGMSVVVTVDTRSDVSTAGASATGASTPITDETPGHETATAKAAN